MVPVAFPPHHARRSAAQHLRLAFLAAQRNHATTTTYSSACTGVSHEASRSTDALIKGERRLDNSTAKEGWVRTGPTLNASNRDVAFMQNYSRRRHSRLFRQFSTASAPDWRQLEEEIDSSLAAVTNNLFFFLNLLI